MSEKVQVLEGDLFNSEAQTLVNTVNCVGVMGKGIALEFSTRFPAMYRDYVKRCADGNVQLGKPYLYSDLISKWIINFPTKQHWRSVSRLEDIVTGLEYLQEHFASWGVTSLAVPPLGSGNGGLEWSVVGPTLYRYLSRLPIPVELYAPRGTSPSQLTRAYLERDVAVDADALGVNTGRLNPAWIALVEILARITSTRYHWPVGRVMFQKVAYFATVFGIPTGLRYERASYGPFAAQLKPALTKLANNSIVTEQVRGSLIEIGTGRTWPDARVVYAQELQPWEAAIQRVADLMTRMTVHEAEMAATIHFVASEFETAKGPPTESDVLREVMAWKQRRRPEWDEAEVALMIRHLAILGVIHVSVTRELTLSDEAVLAIAAEV
jgi:O-acetyl-ADP-ribose deacetylase (regulator of RNase III)